MTGPAQDWMTAREATDHLSIPLQWIREPLQDPGPLPDWAHKLAQSVVTNRYARGESMSTIPRQRCASDATPWPRRASNLPISHPTEVADIVDADTVQRHTIEQIACNKWVAPATIYRLLIVAVVPRRPCGCVPGGSSAATRWNHARRRLDMTDPTACRHSVVQLRGDRNERGDDHRSEL